ncbi:DNA polymerase/3'-5' exonuclease PolX [Salisediminibacterium halotolerans]|uniref:DNA polymerase/3'-5' exonuclease PolX n=1 Tax=Salisediminibacterium halotolerans TaxID=517425 RepID=UPI000EB54B48|nr:DNA polymerase/3'-5' exonuclease PolX [Salisediminibacterium halotolerans]RLJ69436.1 DNA polymerase (family 10) [Actinophytocola xinjiangensis]RPE84058.1 DNA polymerase (family 10) [Salisediminibacterium halotolerans]TWG32511.1 DNA polymerase (family 10) [Salisediminibacterium halotolerans]GEL09044.1 DNA polymerase/3'-5' exonuclease PolX [Salisediminibacterium halotolerans]
MAAIDKKSVIQELERIAVYLEIKGENAFRVSAYRKAAQALEQDERSLAELEDPSVLNGVGKGTAGIIDDLVKTGSTELLDQLKAEIPEGLIPLLKLPGLGGKKIGKLYQELNITSAADLKKACEEKQVRDLSGFGAKTEEKIYQELEDMGKRPERLPVSAVLPAVADLNSALDAIEEVDRFELAGSFRRGRETVKDLDYIISTEYPGEVGERLLSMEKVSAVISSGETKISLELQYDDVIVPVDFRMVQDESFATILHHFTGSKDHNVLMRQRAKNNGGKISEYGVEIEATGEMLHFASEAEFFSHFDLPWIPPEVRNGTTELEEAETYVDLVSINDIQADLHMHTTWSDGAQSIEEMVEACRNRGYSFMAITDHGKFLKVANGLSDERLQRQHEEIRQLRTAYDDFDVFTGIEMDILPDGTLDYSDDVLKNIDFVIASIHSSFNQDENTIMARLEAACNHPQVAMIAHPTGRLIEKRPGYRVDVDRLIQKAFETGTILEINANPNRLDLSAEWAEKAQAAGVKIAVNTDAHRYEMLDHMELGVKTARRAKLKKENVVNTWTASQLKAWLTSTDE